MQRINYAAPDMYAVISDIHGNLEALEAVLRDLPEEVETVYCLGDVIGYGANPDECCNVVRSFGMPTISGNHDLAVTDLETDLNWFNPVAAAAVLWTREHLSEENAGFPEDEAAHDAERARRSSSTAPYATPTSTSSTRPPRRRTWRS